MNRSTRRKFMKNPELLDMVVKTYTAEQQRKAIDLAVRSMAAAVAISLHDKFGWGKDRINRLMAYTMNQYACCSKGTVSIDDLLQWAKEYGVNIDGDDAK